METPQVGKNRFDWQGEKVDRYGKTATNSLSPFLPDTLKKSPALRDRTVRAKAAALPAATHSFEKFGWGIVGGLAVASLTLLLSPVSGPFAPAIAWVVTVGCAGAGGFIGWNL